MTIEEGKPEDWREDEGISMNNEGTWTTADVKPIMDEHSYFDSDYESLYEVLNDAYFQAAGGKGKERHANNLPFDEQPMQRISQLLHTHKGCLFQAMKKIQESTGMEYKAARNELLGAINYIAGAIIYLDKQGRDNG